MRKTSRKTEKKSFPWPAKETKCLVVKSVRLASSSVVQQLPLMTESGGTLFPLNGYENRLALQRVPPEVPALQPELCESVRLPNAVTSTLNFTNRHNNWYFWQSNYTNKCDYCRSNEKHETNPMPVYSFSV